MNESFHEFDLLDTGATLRTMLTLAIQLGSPVYNSGDARGCYEIYAATGRMLLNLVEVAPEEKALLKNALVEAADTASIAEQGWVLRRAFDTLLGD